MDAKQTNASSNGGRPALDGSSDNVDQLIKLQGFIEALPDKLAQSPYQYDLYTEWIGMLKTLDDKDMLRSARETIHAHLALTEAMWKEWIEDEKSELASSDHKDYLRILKVFDDATAEYLTSGLWLDYLDFYDQHRTEIDAAHPGLDIYDRALRAFLHHYTDMGKIWNRYKDRLTASLEDQSADNADELKDRLNKLYIECLGIPHETIDQTFAGYSTFVTTHMHIDYERQMVKVNKIYSATKRLCESRENYERQLEPAGHAWSVYRNYLEFLFKIRQPDYDEIRTVYERALVYNYFDPAVWDEYLTFLETHAFDNGEIKTVIDRSLRNCPHSGVLWGHLLLYAEMTADLALIQNSFDRCIQTHALDRSVDDMAEFLVFRLDVVRRTALSNEPTDAEARQYVQGVCAETLAVLDQLFPESPDPYYRVEKYCSFILAKLLGNIDSAQSVWKSRGRRHKSNSEYWLQYTQFLREHVSASAARTAYKQASSRALDWPERLYDSWKQFEHETGSVETYRQAVAKIQLQRKTIERKREVEYYEQQQQQQQQHEEVKLISSSSKRKSSADEHSNTPEDVSCKDIARASKRNRTASNESSVADKMTVLVSRLPPGTKAAELKLHFSQCGNVRNVQIVRDERDNYGYVTFTSTDGANKALSFDNSEFNGSIINVKPHAGECPDPTTLFVCNFCKDVQKSALRQLFKSYGEVVNIRMPPGDRQFAYIQFGDSEAAARALESDGTELTPGMPLSVAISNPKKKSKKMAGPSEKWQGSTDPNSAGSQSVRLTNFNPATSDDTLRAICQEVAVVLRLHRNKRGDKVFIDVDSQAAALSVVEKFDEMELDGSRLSANLVVKQPEVTAATKTAPPPPPPPASAPSEGRE
ncbi:Splicing factor, partial [Spiromyces aspiralis]